jgi:hypothetical protein
VKRCGLILPILLGLLLTGWMLARAKGFASQAEGTPTADPSDPQAALTTEAILRWNSGQPRHWRACLLQQ